MYILFGIISAVLSVYCYKLEPTLFFGHLFVLGVSIAEPNPVQLAYHIELLLSSFIPGFNFISCLAFIVHICIQNEIADQILVGGLIALTLLRVFGPPE